MSHEERNEPVLGEPANTRLIEVYERYPQAQASILQVLSIVYQPINQTTLQGILDGLGWRAPDGTTRLAEIMAKPLREQFLADGLLTYEKNLLQCHPDIVEVLTRKAAAAGILGQVAIAANAVVPIKDGYPARYREEDPVQIRKLRLALYSGDGRAVLKQLGLESSPFRPQDYDVKENLLTKSLVRICTHPFDRQWFDGLAPALRFQVLAFLLKETAAYLCGSQDAWRLMTDDFGSRPRHPEVAFFLAEQWLYRGEPGKAEALLPSDSSSHSLSLLGWARFAQGRREEAIRHFEAALKAERRKSRKRNVHIPGLAGVCFILALERSGDPSHRELAQKQLLTAAKATGGDRFDPVFRLLGDLLSNLAGEMNAKQSVWLHRDSLAIEPWLDLFRCLALHWLGEKPRPSQLARLFKYCNAAREAGLSWYAREAALLLLKEGKRDTCVEIAGQTDPAAECQPITDLFRPEAPWERTLRALKRVREGGADATAAIESDYRMVWRLYCTSDYCSLEPREQKRTKRGDWTKGRVVSLERLYQQQDSFDYLTPHDRRICRQIEAETVYEYFGRYPRTEYSLDSDQALLEAIGHPLLFWADDPEHPVELTRAEPVLEVMRLKDKLALRLQPFPHPEGNLIPQREGARRLRLVAFSAQHRRIAEILGKRGITVPLKAKEQVLESVAGIAPLLTVHSEIGSGGGAEADAVAADPTPHIHLRPVGEGLALECYIRPFGEAGPLVRPGEGATTLFAEIGGKSVQTTRDVDRERSNASLLLDRCPELDPGADWSWVLEEPESALDTLLRLQELGDRVSLEWPQGRKIRLTAAVNLANMQVSVHRQRDWFALEGELALSNEQVLSMKELLELLGQSPGRFVRLGEGEFLILTKELRRRLEALRSIGDKGRFHPLAAPPSKKSPTAWRSRPARPGESCWRAWPRPDLEPELPSTLQAELRDYQLEGFRWLARLAHWGAGACLADDMGLGKTVQALALILTRAPAGPTLVLAPISVCAQLDGRGATLRADAQGRGASGRATGRQMLDRGGPLRPDRRAATACCRPRGERLAAVSMGQRRRRRGPGDQERPDQALPGHHGPAGGFPHDHHRHPDREPPGRAVEPVPVHQSRPARLPGALQPALRHPHRAAGGTGAARAAPAAADPPLHPAPAQERRPDRAAAAHRDHPAGGAERRRDGPLRGPAPTGHRADRGGRRGQPGQRRACSLLAEIMRLRRACCNPATGPARVATCQAPSSGGLRRDRRGAAGEPPQGPGLQPVRRSPER